MFGCILFLIIHQLSLAIQSQRQLKHQRQPQHYESILPTALGLRIEKLQLYMYAVLYKRKRSFCKNVNLGSVTLAFHYGSCFDASLLRYTL